MRRPGFSREIPLHIMLLPSVLILAIFSYGPMFGLIMAFQDYLPTSGIFHSKWVGLDNYKFLLSLPDTFEVLFNTVFIAVMKILANILVPVSFALLLNEIRSRIFKRTVQTLVYLPFFLSWVILGGILIDILSPSYGIVNQILQFFGIPPVFFLGNIKWFPFVLVITDAWKEFGFGTVIYLAALTGIDPTLYEASVMDGANRIRQLWHITLPGILSIVILMSVLSLGNILNAGFDQVFNLYNPLVYKSGDILDTYIYRIGMVDYQYGLAAATGLFKSVVSFVFIIISYRLADKAAGYRIF